MYMRKITVSVFNGLELVKTNQIEEVEEILTVSEESTFGADSTLTIFVTKDGIGYNLQEPIGYSSYTWWYEDDTRLYKDKDLEWLLRYGLDENMRDMISPNNMKKLEDQYKKFKENNVYSK